MDACSVDRYGDNVLLVTSDGLPDAPDSPPVGDLAAAPPVEDRETVIVPAE